METLEELKDFLFNGHIHYRPNLTVECAIFGYHDGKLQLLLLKNKIVTKWCLPAGYTKRTETLEAAAARITAERTGFDNLFLKQFKVFGGPGRIDPEAVNAEKLFELTGFRLDEQSWLRHDAVAVGFYAITDIINAKPRTDFFSDEWAWFPVNALPKMGFDHNEIANEALSALRIHLYHFPIGKNLLPEKFTLKEIKTFYEVMSGKQLNATHFPNKLISLGLIKKTAEKRSIGAHRSPTYYQFDEKAYETALKEGLVLV
jgi:ADP-ribose pyrophosphatase YjhB (NUDIX family)